MCVCVYNIYWINDIFFLPDQKSAQPQTSSMADTNSLIQAITVGKGLKQPTPRRSENSHQNNNNVNSQGPSQKAPRKFNIYLMSMMWGVTLFR